MKNSPFKIYEISLLMVGLVACFLFENNQWVLLSVGLASFMVLLYDLAQRMDHTIPLIHLAQFNYYFQLVIASVVLYFFPPHIIYDIGHDSYPRYLSFVITCCLAMQLGIALTKNSSIVICESHEQLPSPPWAYYAKHMIWIGLICLFVSPLLSSIQTISFLLLLISNLRFVGLFVMIIRGTQRWLNYTLLILFVELLLSIAGGMFGNLTLWGGVTFLVLSYKYKWRKKAVIGLIISVIVLTFIQAVKVNYREYTWGTNLTIVQSISYFVDTVISTLNNPETLFTEESISTAFVRFNQGWIVNLVMERVPSKVPYAGGETIWDAFYAVVVPRALDPDKPLAGGKVNFERFTGRELKGTSMNIGVVGELYANFGPLFSIAGMLAWGLFLGLLYKWVERRGLINPVWFAWGPFLGFFALKAEEGLMEIVTWIVKGAVVMLFVIFVCRKAWARRSSRVLISG